MIYKCDKCIEIFFNKERYEQHKHPDNKLDEIYAEYKNCGLEVPKYKSGTRKGEMITDLPTLTRRLANSKK